jgi:hypothetical protein
MQKQETANPGDDCSNVRSKEGGVWTEVVAEGAEEDGNRNSGEELEEERVMQTLNVKVP